MERYMITHSLLSSWLYAMKDNPYEDATTERDPYAEFLKSLNREPTETTEAMWNGIQFENLVTAVLNGTADTEDKWYEAAVNVAKRIRGGILQCRASKDIEVSGMNILLYGRLDALLAGVIYDIKFSKSYDVGKYDLCDNVKCPNIRIIGVPVEEDKKKDHEKILEEIRAHV